MEEFKGNSNASKINAEKNLLEKTNEVVTSNVKVAKESELQKFGKRFFTSDAKSVGEHIISDVLVPGVQRLISESIKNGIDWIIYGVKGSSPSSGIGNVSYWKGYSKPSSTIYAPNSSSVSKPLAYSVNEVTFTDRGEAEQVLLRLNEDVERYGMVSVGDFYDFISQKHSYTDLKYGWRDLREAEVVRVRDGYSIRFPKVVPLE